MIYEKSFIFLPDENKYILEHEGNSAYNTIDQIIESHSVLPYYEIIFNEGDLLIMKYKFNHSCLLRVFYEG